MYLENINDDLKALDINQLNILSNEIRLFLINSISETGGHLSSNLGIVELSIVLHRIFDTKHDKIVWDVGHQSYVHKILTGRKEHFGSLRKLDGLSGFPKLYESKEDSFGTGHSSTAISAALGLALARDIQEQTHKIVAVIGDGSMTGGLTYEGLNNAGRSNTNLLVILNDNGMSISKNVGAISRHLNKIRTGKMYLGAKEDIHKFLDFLPVVGKKLSRTIESIKDTIKYALKDGVLFEEMGFRYFGPVNGHDIKTLESILKNVSNIKGPVLLHVLTKKGKGYKKAEESPSVFHGVGSFSVKTGKPEAKKTGRTYTDIFARHICYLAKKNKNIIAITAAMPQGTGLKCFKRFYPDRFFDTGIAESHAVTFAAGLAVGGLRPIVAVYSSFLQRAYDQIVHDIAIQNLPVIFAIDRAGIVGEDGETHQGLYDIAFLNHIPNITIMAPRSDKEFIKMLDFALTLDSPIAIRYPKAIAPIEVDAPDIKLGCIETINKGEQIAIISVGNMFKTVNKAVNILKTHGLNPGLFNARFIKPIDPSVINILKCYSKIFVIEDSTSIGGYLQGILDVQTISFPDNFIEAGSQKELFKRFGLDENGIADSILKNL